MQPSRTPVTGSFFFSIEASMEAVIDDGLRPPGGKWSLNDRYSVVQRQY